MIILLEILLLLRLRNLLKNEYHNIDLYLLVASVVQAIMIIVFRLELESIGREVFYSDSESYWANTLQLLNGSSIDFLGSQFGYALWSYYIQKTSVFIWAGWNNISNILLYDLALLIMIFCINDTGYFRIIPAILCNPLAIYGIMRNLKDGLFIFLTAVILFCFFSFQRNKRVLYMIIAALFDVLISTVRPWGFLVLPTLFVATYLWDFKNTATIKSSRIKIVFFTIVTFLLFIVVVYSLDLNKYLELWIPIVFENAKNRSIIENISAPFRMLIGPGIYRSFFGEKYFMYNMQIASFSAGLGSFMWWCSLSRMLSNIKGINITRQGSAFLSLFLLFIIIYTLQNGGSLEHRMRSVLYLLGSVAFFSNYKGNYNIDIMTITILFIIIIFGTIISL